MQSAYFQFVPISMTLNEHNAPLCHISLFSRSCFGKVHEDRSILSVAKDSPGSIDYINVYAGHKFAGVYP